MKYLTRFKTEEEYNQARPQIDKLEYNVSWIEMANENNVRYGGTREPSITTHQCSFICDDNNSNPIIPISGDTSWIKGRRCLVKKTDSGVAICYLDDNNSELFHDGTSAKLDGSMGQWMTDIPSYRYSHEGGEYDINNIQNLVHNITLTHNDTDDSITEWGNKGLFRRCLVGVTEAVVYNYKLWSRKTGNEVTIGNLSSVSFHNYATVLGNGFDIIDYETHCKIAHLFYAKYGNRNPQGMSQFGSGENLYNRIIGTTSSLGNNDGKTSTQITFLGIEDFYGGKYEWMSGLHSNDSIYYIYDGFEPNNIPTVNYRTIDIGGSYIDGFISKVYWGEHGDMIPIEISKSSAIHYCDWGDTTRSSWQVARRSYQSNFDDGGVACFVASDKSSDANRYIDTRIQYRGSIQVIEDPAEFIALPVGF
jgi:hypothetical protein